ncbi:MAG: DUF1360 domain-containing protein [Chloroflexi bacterium]|nr:DUF1360 domain-containing protein [Chloroflexota bacterium]
MPSELTPLEERRITYTSLSSTFLTIFSLMSLVATRKKKHLELKPLQVVQLAFATYRLGRLISYDTIFETYRAPFTETVADPSGAGKTVVPKGKGTRRAIGELIACPICAGTWIAAWLVYGLTFLPRPTQMFIQIMSTIGIAEFINAATEALEWSGQEAREQAGSERGDHTAGDAYKPLRPKRTVMSSR